MRYFSDRVRRNALCNIMSITLCIVLMHRLNASSYSPYRRDKICKIRINRLIISIYKDAAESMALSRVLGIMFARAQS